MSLLSSSFDVVRGWPSEAADELDIPAHSGTTLQEGMLCYIENASGSPTAALATSVPVEGADTGPLPFWLVVEGNTSNEFDALATGNVTLIKASQVQIQTTLFVSNGSLVPGALLTVSDGQASDGSDPVGTEGYLTLKTGDSADFQTVGVVVANNVSASSYTVGAGTLTVALISR